MSLRTFITTSVAKWACFQLPYGASSDEIEAAQSQRKAYTSQLVDALGHDASKDRRKLLKAAASVLGSIEAEPASRGIPSVQGVLMRVRDALEPSAKHDREMPWCSECERQGGVRLASDAPLSDKRRSDATSVDRNGPREPLCGIHLAEAAYRSALEAFETGRVLETVNHAGDTERVAVSRRPSTPSSMRPSVRSPDSDRWIARFISQDAE